MERKHHVLVITLDLSAVLDLQNKDKLKKDGDNKLPTSFSQCYPQRRAFVKENEKISMTFDNK